MATATLSDCSVADSRSEVSSRMSILERIAEGDQSAVTECLDEFGGLIWSLARRMSVNAEDAEDATQEIFVELWQKANRFDPQRASEATFVSMLARRRLIDRLRKNGREPCAVNEEGVLDQVAAEPLEIKHVELKDDAAKAARCIEKLNRDQRRIVQLSIHVGISHSKISKQLAMPLGTVKSYARRALLQLRECMRRPVTSSAAEAAS